MKKSKKAILLTGIFACTPALANNFELNVGAPYYNFDTKNQSAINPAENAIGGAISGAYRFDNPLSLELVLSQAQSEFSNNNSEFDLTDVRLDGLFHFLENNKLSPYIAAGVGYWDVDFNNNVKSDETSANIGLGVKYKFAENFGLRLDTRYLHTLDFDSGHSLATLGLNYIFGKSSSSKSKNPMLLKNEMPQDSDFDGIADINDKCLDTPKSVDVDSNGCPLDTDRDSVADYRDKCVDSDPNLMVDVNGCTVIENQSVTIKLDVEFDTNSAEVKPEYFPQIAEVKKFLKLYPNASVSVEGHSDNTGRADYNLALSTKRAKAITQILISEFGVPENRVNAAGFGDSRPVASNDSPTGRAKNRRVQAEFSAMKQAPKYRSEISNIPADDFE